MTTERETLTAKAERWEGDESIILACGGPVGGTLSDRDAAIIVHWLNDRGALGELAWRLRATPPAEGPVVEMWIAWDKAPIGLACVYSDEPSRVEEHGRVVFLRTTGYFAPLLPGVADLLGLRPGECRRVRLTVLPEGESDGK